MSDNYQAVNDTEFTRPPIRKKWRARFHVMNSVWEGTKVVTTKSSTEQVRRANSVLILRTLRKYGAQSHTQIISETNLASATVSAITAELAKAGVIAHSEQAAGGGRGRPRVLFEPARSAGYLATIAISSEVIQFSLIDYSGRLLDRFDEARGKDDGDVVSFVKALQHNLQRLTERSNIPDAKVLAISISSKGIVDAHGPTLKWSPIFGSNQVDFAEIFAKYKKASVMLCNETLLVADALAAREKRSLDGLAVLSLGHSIGLGVVTFSPDRAVVTAPNFGHMLHVPDGAKCRCGANGCVEAYAGFYAILRTAFEVPKDTIPAKFVPIPAVDKIAENARRGDRMAAFAFRQAGVALGTGLSRLLSLYGLMPIIITGPGIRYYDLLQSGLESGLNQAHVVRMQGMPEITIEFNELELVYDGHLGRSLNIMDERIIGL